jgi:phage/plasmid-associated DNA primase
VAEGFDVAGFLDGGPRMSIKPANATPSQEATVWATDDALALSFTGRYAEDWRYCAAWGKWLVWDGRRWQADETLLVHHLIRAICREAALKADSHRLAAKLAVRGMGCRPVRAQHAGRHGRSENRAHQAARPTRADDQADHRHAAR